jgi:hypothetical protein
MDKAQKNINEAELIKYPPPKWTDTWHPIGHDEAFQDALDGLENIGVEVTDTRVDLTCGGKRMFATFEMHLSGLKQFFVGLRNSYDKAFGLGVCAGLKIINCSNLMFGGDFLEVRRHTKGLDYDTLPDLLRDYLETATGRSYDTGNWLEGLKMVELVPRSTAFLTVEAMKVNALSPRQFHQFNGLMDERYRVNKEVTVYSWHEALTECCNRFNLETIIRKTGEAEVIIDSFLKSIGCESYTMAARLGEVKNSQRLLFDGEETTNEN